MSKLHHKVNQIPKEYLQECLQLKLHLSMYREMKISLHLANPWFKTKVKVSIASPKVEQDYLSNLSNHFNNLSNNLFNNLSNNLSNLFYLCQALLISQRLHHK